MWTNWERNNGAVAFIPSFADRYTRSISLENNNEWLNFAF